MPAASRCRIWPKLIDGVLYPLWDIGLKIGYSVRDLDDCVKVANTDMQSKTSLIESRLITGDAALFAKFQKAVVQQMRGRLRGKIHRRCAWKTRPRGAASTAIPPCMQEPNIKNGCGGLRDFQNLLWMAFFKYRTRSLRGIADARICQRGRAQAVGGRV